MYISSFILILSGILYTKLFLVYRLRRIIRPRMARECIVHPARGSLESAETFISEARGGALSFPGFNGEDSWSSRGKMKLYLMFFLQLLKMVRTERD